MNGHGTRSTFDAILDRDRCKDIHDGRRCQCLVEHAGPHAAGVLMHRNGTVDVATWPEGVEYRPPARWAPTFPRVED